MNPLTLAVLGQQLLANMVTDIGAGGLSVPARQVFSHGTPVRDCDQVAVWIERVEIGGAAGFGTASRATQGATHTPYPQIVTWGVDVTVCGEENVHTPDSARVTADGVLGARYLWVVTRALTGRWKNASMFAPYEQQLAGGKGLTVQGSRGAMDGGMVTVTATFSVMVKDVP